MKKLKIAQIGIGHDHAPMIFQSLKKQTDKYEVVGYALPENEAIDYADKLGCFDGVRRFSVEEICNNTEIDAVTVETEEKYLQLQERQEDEISLWLEEWKIEEAARKLGFRKNNN